MKLTPQQLNNLLVFLNRVELKGSEAETLTELKIIITRELQTLATPVKEDKKEDKK